MTTRRGGDYQIALKAVGTTPKPAFAPHQRVVGFRPEPRLMRPRVGRGHGVGSTPRSTTAPTSRRTVLAGPAIIDQLDSTTVVPPGTRAEIDDWLNILIHVTEATR